MPINDRTEHSPQDPHFRYSGARTDYDRSPEAARLRRRTQFDNIQDFAAWRKSHGMPDLSDEDLAECWRQFKGEAPGEKAMLEPILERR